jgi:4-alpha-glucanotransferase
MQVHFYLRYTSLFGQWIEITPLKGAAAKMTYINDEYWRATLQIADNEPFVYGYTIKQQGAHDIHMHGYMSLDVQDAAATGTSCTVIDAWNGMDNQANIYFTQALRKILSTTSTTQKTTKKVGDKSTHRFAIKVPKLGEHEVPVLVGAGAELHDWSTHQPIMMQHDCDTNVDFWLADLDLSTAQFPITYKYAIYNTKLGSIARYEDDTNRTLYFDYKPNEKIYIQDGFIRVPLPNWRGSGVAIPVFSLRSADSFGCGSFSDLKQLADWAVSVGMNLIQLLPINDTAATGTWTDSYPYASISAYALNPIYINAKAITGKKADKKSESLVKTIYARHQTELANLQGVDYELTLKYKWQMLTALYEAHGTETLASPAYQTWFWEQAHWLKPYAAFCVLKDQFGTNKYHTWAQYSAFQASEIDALTDLKSISYPKVALHYFVQWHLHSQLLEATQYANRKGLVVKGDIPIGIYRYSADAWVAPELYNMDMQAGAPPDDFSTLGQNWEFPTYRWDVMKKDGFAWWRSRFKQMSYYFDAFRIDHILGFFRIWSIPTDAVQGILGRFDPAIPVGMGAFLERGIRFERKRFSEPYIAVNSLNEIFGQEAIQAAALFLTETETGYQIKPKYNTQRKVEQWFLDSERSKTAEILRDGMYDLIANVILFETETPYGPAFHFRYGIEKTNSFRALDEQSQHQLRLMYNDYFFRAQDDMWEREAMEKLPELRKATNMLICGEDLGMVPNCVPDVMARLSLLSLEIQRMPKAITSEFADPSAAPYLSVVTPSTHDMSTIRGWWEEDKVQIDRFFKQTYHTSSRAPHFCEPFINQTIVAQHLNSPAMWAIFQLQDLMGIDGELRFEDPRLERINEPSNPKHYWRYRMHLTLEQLMTEGQFNTKLADLIYKSGR